MSFIGVSEFYLQNNDQESGNSYTLLSPDELAGVVSLSWEDRVPGAGEMGLERKVLVPLRQHLINDSGGPLFFCPPRIPLVEGMPIRAEITRRKGTTDQEPSVEVFVTPETAYEYGFGESAVWFRKADRVQVVCYSAETLLENGGVRTTEAPWEIVTLLCEQLGDPEPMQPLTMARNFLEKPGGTKSIYSPREFAEAIWYHKTRGIKVRRPKQ